MIGDNFIVANFPRLTATSFEAQGEEACLQTISAVRDRSALNEVPCDQMKPLPNGVRPKVSVIIVTYGSNKEIPDCVESLLKQSVPIEIFLVDNASPDNTAKMVSDYAARYENIHAILNTENVGLAAGNNTPMGKCQGEYLLMLNPDTLFRDNSLEHMVEFLDRNPDVGIVGPKNMYANGEPHMSFGRSWGLLQVVTWRVIPYRFPRLLHDRLSSYKTQDVLFVSGSCLLIRRNIFQQIGGYDSEYFLTIEDVCDLCIRTKQTGSRVVFLPDAEVVHLGGRSGAQAPYVVVWQGYRGSIYHFLKHKGITQAVIVLTLLLVSSGLRFVIATAIGIFKQRYRSIARIYASVFWSLLVRSPLRANGWRLRGSVAPKSARFDGAPL
jgi:N-acetylglucosaminyl-diphospho-decaprenol L-rhamnosyltransferase